MNGFNVPWYSCRLCKIFLEERNLVYAIDKRNGNPVLFCNGCREDGEKFRDGKITEEEFRKSVKNRWEDETKKTFLAALKAMKEGWIVEMIKVSGKTAESIKCCQLLKWFNESDEEKKSTEFSSFLFILDNLNKKGKLCSECLSFYDNLQTKLTKL